MIVLVSKSLIMGEKSRSFEQFRKPFFHDEHFINGNVAVANNRHSRLTLRLALIELIRPIPLRPSKRPCLLQRLSRVEPAAARVWGNVWLLARTLVTAKTDCERRPCRATMGPRRNIPEIIADFARRRAGQRNVLRTIICNVSWSLVTKPITARRAPDLCPLPV